MIDPHRKYCRYETIFRAWKKEHGRTYTGDEHDRKLQVFSDLLDDVESHNVEYDAGTQSWFKALNQFSDMTKEEFKRDVIDGGSEKGCYKQKKKGNLRPPTARLR